MILDFKNLDKNPDYQYLEDSITEAVRTELKAKFDFKEMKPDDWRSLAAKNYYLWPEENHNRGFALNLGLLAKQDIAVGGYYQAIIEKKPSRGVRAHDFVIRAHVFVLDIGKRKVVSEFDLIMPADASLFSSIEVLAGRVVKESRAVLPNKGEAGQQRFDDDEIGPHEIGLIAGTGIVSVPAQFGGNYTTDVALFTKDFKSPVAVGAFYAHHDFIKPHVILHLAGGGAFASADLPVSTDSKKIRSALLDLSVAGHLGYELEFWRFSVTPLAGGGFSLASLKLDYSTLSVLPVDAHGNTRSDSTLNLSGPFAEGGLKATFRMTSRLILNVYGLYRQSFYIGNNVGQVFASGGVSFRL